MEPLIDTRSSTASSLSLQPIQANVVPVQPPPVKIVIPAPSTTVTPDTTVTPEPPTCFQRFLKIVHHPVTSCIMTVASAAGVVAAGVIGNVPALVASGLVLGYYRRAAVEHLKKDSCVNVYGNLVKINSTMEVFFLSGIATNFVGWATAAAAITSVFAGEWGYDRFHGLKREFASGSAPSGSGPIVEDLQTGEILQPLLPSDARNLPLAPMNPNAACTRNSVCEFISNNKGTIFVGITGAVLVGVGVGAGAISSVQRVFSVHSILAAYGMRMIGSVIGKVAESFLFEKRALNPRSTTYKILYSFVNINKIVLGTSTFFLSRATTELAALLLCLPLGFATGANYSYQRRLFNRIECIPMTPQDDEPLGERRTCINIISIIDKVASAALLAGGIVFLVLDGNNHNPITTNADAGTFMVTIPFAYYLTRAVERRPTDHSLGRTTAFLKKELRYLMQFSPLQITAEYQLWNANLTSPTLPVTPAQLFGMIIYNAHLIGWTYGSYRGTTNYVQTIRPRPEYEQIFYTHYRGELLANLMWQILFPQNSSS